MKYYFDDFFPIKTEHMTKKISEIMGHVTSNSLMWIASNREFGEKERYRVKAEVDESLRETEVIWKERERIEKFFQSNEIISNGDAYIEFYKRRMIQLNRAYERIENLEITKENITEFWKSVVDISNIDNAHAMYLSSNNWEFSVFNQVLEELLEILQGDYNKLNPLLTAGIEDVRSSIFTMNMQQYLGLKKEDFYSNIVENKDYIRSNGVCPFFSYIVNETPSFKRRMDRTEYEMALKEVLDSLHGNMRQHFLDVYECYCKLYFTRMAYDTYEYFGYYSFIRHYAIFVTYNMLSNEDVECANMFKHYISTYQFERAVSILGKE